MVWKFSAGSGSFFFSKLRSFQKLREFRGVISRPFVSGIHHLKEGNLNKGLAFSLEERQILCIHGLQPARIKTQEEQLEVCKLSLNMFADDLNKFMYLISLQIRNEKLFYKLISENVAEMLPLVYTPTVALACEKFGFVWPLRPRGFFVSLTDKGHIFDLLKNWPEPVVRAIVVTDGERILGLGDLGVQGIGIPIGKLALYTALAGIKPQLCMPVILDVGTNNKKLLDDPLYVGLRQPRVSGKVYDEFVDEFMQAVSKRFGPQTLIQFEDFGSQNSFRLLDKYKDKYCTFNDDIQGTAAVVVAGLIASKRLTQKKISDNKIIFLGAGQAAVGIADLCVTAMVNDGSTKQQARDNIWMVDMKGLLTTDRPDLDCRQCQYAKEHEAVKDLLDIVNRVKPSIIIGASAASGAFTPEILEAMGTFNERPIVFALSNPTSKAECTALQAYEHTQGKCIFSSGSPFGKVEFKGQTFHPGQGNNAYIFPGVALGVIASGCRHVPDEVFLIAAQTLAKHVTDADILKGSLFPPLEMIRVVSFDVAIEIAKYAYEKGLASLYPEPKDKKSWLEEHIYNFNYESSLPKTWPWP